MDVLVDLLVPGHTVLEITAGSRLLRLSVEELDGVGIAGVGLRLLIWDNKWRGLIDITVLLFLDEIVN